MKESEFVQSTYNAVGASYAARYGDTLFLLQQFEQFAARLPAGAAVLDVGCGAGRATRWFVQHGYNVTGVDFSDTMLTLARQAAPEATVLSMDIRAVDFADATFDAVWSSFSIIHIPKADVARTLSGWYRALKPGGVISIITSLGADEEEVRDEWLTAADGSMGHKIFFHHVAQETLACAAVTAGFTGVQTAVVFDAVEMGTHPILVLQASRA
ncbi:MAG: class I SAM-dependent methyltransferase [Patescibacteria group bacterium]